MKSLSVEFRDPSDLPHSSYWPDPIDAIEPLPDDDADDGRSFAAQVLCDSLIYLSEFRGSLVLMGSAAVLLCQTFAPHRVAPTNSGFVPQDEAEMTAKHTFPIWEWLADSRPTLSAFGMRAHILLYVVRNDLIGGMTLESIGALDNSTRQAVDKLVSDLRDVLNGQGQGEGVRNPAMKSEITRTKCQQVQTERRAA